jgi:hypothetical protein
MTTNNRTLAQTLAVQSQVHLPALWEAPQADPRPRARGAALREGWPRARGRAAESDRHAGLGHRHALRHDEDHRRLPLRCGGGTLRPARRAQRRLDSRPGQRLRDRRHQLREPVDAACARCDEAGVRAGGSRRRRGALTAHLPRHRSGDGPEHGATRQPRRRAGLPSGLRRYARGHHRVVLGATPRAALSHGTRAGLSSSVLLRNASARSSSRRSKTCGLQGGRSQILPTETVDHEALAALDGVREAILGVGERRFVHGILGSFTRTAAFRMNVHAPRMEPGNVVELGVVGLHFRAGQTTEPRLMQLVGDAPAWTAEAIDEIVGLTMALDGRGRYGGDSAAGAARRA